MEQFRRKTFEIQDLETKSLDGAVYISGYANTKGKADSYGDVPTNFEGKPVYDLSRFNKNPVMFVDHCTSVSSIMGVFTQLVEDAAGLRFVARLMPIDQAYTDEVQHAISAYANGYARALSIGGKWIYADPQNPSHLTTAIIYEISGVGIGADDDALTTMPIPKSAGLKQGRVNQLKTPGVIAKLKSFKKIKGGYHHG